MAWIQMYVMHPNLVLMSLATIETQCLASQNLIWNGMDSNVCYAPKFSFDETCNYRNPMFSIPKFNLKLLVETWSEEIWYLLNDGSKLIGWLIPWVKT